MLVASLLVHASRRRLSLFAAVLALVRLLAVAAAAATPGADGWEAQTQRIRALLKSDVPAALQLAQRLESSLGSDAPPARRIEALNLLARAEAYGALSDLADDHAQRALALAREQHDRVGQVEADLNININAVNLSRIDLLVAATNDGMAAIQGLHQPDLVVEMMLQAAVTNRRIGQFNESVELALRALEIAQRSGSPAALTYAHQALGISFSQSDRHIEADEHFRAMRTQAQRAHFKLEEALALLSLATSAAQAGDFRAADSQNREAIALLQQLGAPFALAHARFGLADTLRLQGRHAEAIEVLQGVQDIYTRYPNKIGRWFLLNALSLAHEALKDRPAAWASAQQAYELAQIIGLPVYRTEADQRLGALAAASGNYKLAYEYALDAARLQARAASEKASSHIVELAQRYENENRQRAFEELTQRNQLQTSELRQRELRNLYLSALLGLSLAALAGSAFFVIRLRRSDNAVRALNATLEQRVEASTAELRRTQGYLRVLLDTLPLWAWFKDTGGRYLAVNRATAAACGVAVPDMVGRQDEGLSPPGMEPILRAEDSEVLTRRERHTYEAALPDRGQPVWMEVYKAPVLADDGTLLGIVGVARDISERKAAEAAREAALAEAERLARQRSGFLAQMSHELRTPLNGILGFVQILQREKSLTERQVRGLKIIGESGQHLLTLINDILDLARIDAGRLEFCPSEFELPGFLDVVSDIVRVKAEEKGLLYVLQADATLPAAVRADEKRLRQVLLNLLSNAVKFTDKGMVSLTVSARPGRAGHSRLRFDVRDSGIGMTPAQQSRLFQPFEQVGDAKRREGGTGLGLAISQQLVRLMGGDIRVESESGQGSHFGFEVELPVVAPTTAPHAHGVPVGYVGPRKRVLIADDSASNRAVLVEALRQLDFEVDEAADGAQAVLRALLGHPDLVIMDVVMPVMDGIDATRAVRESAGLSHIPVIACSGSADDGMRAACRAAGANGFLSKPVDLDELLELIRQCLRLEWRWEARQPVPARP